MKTILSEYLEDFAGLFYPRLCMACKTNPALRHEITCIQCQYELKINSMYREKENEITEKFWGRIPLESAAAMYVFMKGGKVRNMIHQLKYKNQWEVGMQLGKHYGKTLLTAPHFEKIEAIIPVPLHPKKQKKRGYNQSEAFAQGLSEGMQKPYFPHALKRVIHSTSLTKKSRDERFESIKNAFAVKDSKSVERKHILLVDDVLTTGATIEACAMKLLELSEVKLSIAVIGMGEN